MRDLHPPRRNLPLLAPPSPYEAAMYRHAWALTAPYVQNLDLYSACLVCRQWNSIFSPLLWGNPGSRFGQDSDNIYLSLTRFKRLLVRARLEVRRLVHTLHIPPAQPEFYEGPQAGWLRDLLDRLPCLQALIVENLSFFDHQALETVHHSNGSPLHNDTKYGLRLLIASQCENTTPASLAKALLHFPDLIYLDLSSTQGSRNPLVLRQIGTLSQLHVLKMQSCGLRDADVEFLTFSERLRSLDVSDNYLTEKGISNLIGRLPPSSLSLGALSITSPAQAAAKMKRSLLQNLVLSGLMNGPNGHLLIGKSLPSGFADLYLAGNHLTIDELSRILNHPSIEFLDCGSLNCSQRPESRLSPLSPGSLGSFGQGPVTPEVDQLSPALFTAAFRNIKSLRIHYSVLSSFPFSGHDVPLADQCFELHSEDLRYELESTELPDPGNQGLVFELDDTSKSATPEPDETKKNAQQREGSKPEQLVEASQHTVVSINALAECTKPRGPDEETHAVYESPDSIGANLSPSPILQEQHNGHERVASPIEPNFSTRNGAPPQILVPAINTPSSRINKRPHVHDTHPTVHSHLVQPTSVTAGPTSAPHGPETFRYRYYAGEDHRWHRAGQSKHHTDLKELIEEVKLRLHRTQIRERHPGRLKPSMLPNLKVLTLTDVPSTTRRQNVIGSLMLFMQECAEEEELAKLEHFEKNLDHGKSRSSESECGILKLQRLVLEMTSAPDPILPSRSLKSKRNSFTRSSTEDADSESFMEASEMDFSFFGEDDGGLLVSEGRLDAPRRVDDGMIVNGFLCNPIDTKRSLDVVSELSGFRREKRMKHEAMARYGPSKIDSALLGHWAGEVKVVKNIVCV